MIDNEGLKQPMGEDPNQQPIQQPNQQPVQSPIQIPIDEKLQDILVEIVLQDFDRAKTARDNREYGKNEKGIALNFDGWMKALKDLYYGNRLFKNIPWKYCSNRSMKISMAILEMLHSRLLAATWNENRLRWRPGGLEDVDKVDRIDRFMFWWLMVKYRIRDFFDGWVKVAIGFGDVATKLGWEVREYDTGQVDTLLS